MSSTLYLLPKNNTDDWNLNSKNLTLNLSSTGIFDLKINTTSKLSINTTNNVLFKDYFYSVTTPSTAIVKVFFSSSDPGGAASPGDIWFNTSIPS